MELNFADAPRVANLHRVVSDNVSRFLAGEPVSIRQFRRPAVRHGEPAHQTGFDASQRGLGFHFNHRRQLASGHVSLAHARCQLFGLDAGAHHLVNLLFHAANTLLLFHVLRRMTHELWPSAAVAALFALHPLHVESVAWVSERKDV